MKDITNRADVSFFVEEFYKLLLTDDRINHFFLPLVEHGQLDTHLKTITNFWHDMLFLTSDYGKNAMKPHLELHQHRRMTATHFSTWLQHFNQTIDGHFSGEKAILAKTRALSIATIMQIKLRDL